jgi:hypothetical protein
MTKPASAQELKKALDQADWKLLETREAVNMSMVALFDVPMSGLFDGLPAAASRAM